MEAIVLIIGCALAGWTMQRAAAMHHMELEEAEQWQRGSNRIGMLFIAFVLLGALFVFAGCGSFWQAQGDASRTSAQARLRSAEAERQNAQAAIIDAEARGALAESQAAALTTTINANADLTRSAISLADNGEYVILFAVIALAGLALAAFGIWSGARRPVAIPTHQPPVMLPALKPGITIESIAGPVRLEQADGETRYHFMIRVRDLAQAIQAAEDQRLLGPGDRS